MLPRFPIPSPLMPLAAMPMLTLLLTACQPALQVRPAEPLPAPKVAIPAFLLTCPPVPSWVTQTCGLAPVPQPTR